MRGAGTAVPCPYNGETRRLGVERLKLVTLFGAVVEELNADDAAGEGLFVRRGAGFVAAEDLSDVAELLNAIGDRVFVEGAG